LVVQPMLADYLGDLGHDFGFRFFILRSESGVVFGHYRFSWRAKPWFYFVVEAFCETGGGHFFLP